MHSSSLCACPPTASSDIHPTCFYLLPDMYVTMPILHNPMLKCILVAILLTPASANTGSYWDLAEEVVPGRLADVLDMLDGGCLTDDTGPGGVKPLRIAVLRARESLDIFSFAYPCSLPSFSNVPDNGGKPPADKLDIWLSLRRDLDKGYEVLGNFQDLDHSDVEYNETDARQALKVCLEWQDCFVANRYKYGYERFVKSAEHGSIIRHRHESKLFWGYKGTKPKKHLTGGENIVRLVRESQLQQLQDNYTELLTFEHVYEDPVHLRFHKFRKIARSVVSVLEFFPELTGKKHDAKSTHGTNTKARGSYSYTRRALRALQPKRHVIHKPALTVSARQGQPLEHAVDPTCNGDSAHDLVFLLFKNMGKVNDQVFAYEFYQAHDSPEQAEQSKQLCDSMWAELKQWMQQVKMDEVLACLASCLQDW